MLQLVRKGHKVFLSKFLIIALQFQAICEIFHHLIYGLFLSMWALITESSVIIQY